MRSLGLPLFFSCVVACVASHEASSTDDAAAPAVEKRCGESPTRYFAAYTRAQIDQLAGCTVLVGRFQQDSVSELSNFGGLERVTRIEGALNVFRSPGFTSLRGFDNLETVDGDLYIHLNPNLASLAALAKLRTVTGNLYVSGNGALPASEREALARVSVGGKKTLEP